MSSTQTEKVIALAGNPNVGKSTVFNTLTGMKQHTGNWPGKTVCNAQGTYQYAGETFSLVDLPGTYSLMSASVEEEVARDFICFGGADATIIVADATCLERNLNLVLQILEITSNAVLCVNLSDEAEKKKIHIDFDELSLQLGIPIVSTNARKGCGINELIKTVAQVCSGEKKTFQVKTKYSEKIEKAISDLEPLVKNFLKNNSSTPLNISPRWLCLKLIDSDETLLNSINKNLSADILCDHSIKDKLSSIKDYFLKLGKDSQNVRDEIVTSIVMRAETIYKHCVRLENPDYNQNDRKIDKILTSKKTGIPIMIALLCVIFWITIVGANYPSELLSTFLFKVQNDFSNLLSFWSTPEWLKSLLVDGVYKTLAWVVSVMLPPMAIFFPLFTLLEDLGYLPRIAFNMDNIFKKCGAHGKQSLTMCMGFGCNACGVIGARIIDSPRERLIAIITNNFVPCNGRLPPLYLQQQNKIIEIKTNPHLTDGFLSFHVF